MPAAAQDEKAAEPAAVASEAEKSSDDPTKIATKIGVSYADELFVSGSLAIGPKIKFNARISESGKWAAGASYLFPFAILTATASKSKLDSGVEQTRYALGGFVPLNQLGLKTGRWMIFVPFGYSYTKGRGTVTDVDQGDGFPVDLSSSSGYVGAFVLRPLGPKLTAQVGTSVSKGTNDFSGISVGGGLSYHFTGKDTVGVSGSYSNNSFGSNETVRVSYRHEF